MFGNANRELVLVGAGHLPGEDAAYWQLLKAAGCTIENFILPSHSGDHRSWSCCRSAAFCLFIFCPKLACFI